jgi:1-acyl-sn-glycerol-3-phosphate acyltransferase
MNDQPYGIPPKFWPPKLTPWWFRMLAPMRRSALKKQRMSDVALRGTDQLARAVDNGCGVLITPNHSFHWDSYCLIQSAERLRIPFYFMSAWQVFSASRWFECESMQRCGCFSVDREGTDIQSLKMAVDILQSKKNPLVIFPEGDIYHTNDAITPFRDGAAAIALMAARKSERPICILPVAIKRWYIEDPTPSVLQTIAKIEQRMLWDPKPHLPIVERVLNIAQGLIALKETEYLQSQQSGTLAERIGRLTNYLLEKAESRYGLQPKSDFVPDRIKEVRRAIISLREQLQTTSTAEQQEHWNRDMHTMFLATQLFSYPGNYLLNEPSIERIVETVDKLEEDIMGAIYPTVHGEKRVVVQFDTPIHLPNGKERKLSAADLTDKIEQRVQSMIDHLNVSSESGIQPDVLLAKR